MDMLWAAPFRVLPIRTTSCGDPGGRAAAPDHRTHRTTVQCGTFEGDWFDGVLDGLSSMNGQIDALGQIINNVCNPPKADVVPGDLCEQLALAEAKAGAGVPIMAGLWTNRD